MDGHGEFLRFGPAVHSEFFPIAESLWPQSQQLIAIHCGSVAIVIMHNGTKSNSCALHLYLTPT